MLDRAAERFAKHPPITVRAHDLADPLCEPSPVDAVVSALAIHHLPDRRKRTLFSESTRCSNPAECSSTHAG